jgi:hypothetical protein
MFLQDCIDYLNTSNSSRITGLSVYDPFAIFGFVLLVLVVLIALILLTVTARRSAESIWDGIHDARFRRLRRSTRVSALVGDLAPLGNVRMSQNSAVDDRSTRATLGKHVSFQIPETPRKTRTSTISINIVDEVAEPLLPLPHTPITPRRSQATAGRYFDPPLPSPYTAFSQQAFEAARASATFLMYSAEPAPPAQALQYNSERVTAQAGDARRAPKISVKLEREESRRRWTRDFQDELVRAAGDMV